jgi:hypothetical protein
MGDRPSDRARRRSLRLGLALVAVLGVVLTAGVAYAASHLVSESIGLASEPAELDRSLAPAESAASPTRSRTTTAPATTTTSAPEAQPRTTTTTPAAGGSGTSGDAGGRAIAPRPPGSEPAETRTAPQSQETQTSESSPEDAPDRSGHSDSDGDDD